MRMRMRDTDAHADADADAGQKYGRRLGTGALGTGILIRHKPLGAGRHLRWRCVGDSD